MAYLTLAGAILSEILATTAMKYSHGFTKLWPSVGTTLGYLVAFALLAQTLKSMSVGTTYAIWSGAGTAVIAAIGTVFLGESTSPLKILGVLLVIAGVVVLNLDGAH
ncbi:QacE family quaternary ammonium compound efflux SMR transporter [Streptomyces albospinus]|uniref:QacE family quaternary ammonium compound efflux SMR transporter n=1 Tax=Streptomyces albospinus TaxID=285515 RepID=A0ABQ2VKC5_9ACTN|nr:multidrug efflux SMR transporter [Streptomyces albospinus]GGU91082.1 QacE family quaternary ammonium compound efflux SMR transporter [Streptomyces albospinus]